MEQHFIAPDAVIAELQQKADACEKQAIEETGPVASELREEANLYRTWIALLRSGSWTA
jgi:hypothetical protein